MKVAMHLLAISSTLSVMAFLYAVMFQGFARTLTWTTFLIFGVFPMIVALVSWAYLNYDLKRK